MFSCEVCEVSSLNLKLSEPAADFMSHDGGIDLLIELVKKANEHIK